MKAKARLVLVTGLSGSGKSTVAKCFEDLGYYCVDNMPLPMLSQFVTAPLDFVPGRDHIAVVMDMRAPGFAAEAPRLLEGLDRGRLQTTLVFLESSEEALMRRFSESRRPHPFSDELPVLECIRAERAILSELRGAADLILDTSDWSIHDIRSLIYREFGRDAGHEPVMNVSLVSFGFKHGIPFGADLLFDVRFLPNPHFDPELRPLSGLDEPVRDFLRQRTDFQELVARLADLLRFLLPRYQQENRSYLTIGIGCTGGQHRSVASVEALAAALEEAGWTVRVKHRDLERARP
ncbi:MAG: RNase adapter RapZ [Thermoanaerobaculia bacterium]